MDPLLAPIHLPLQTPRRAIAVIHAVHALALAILVTAFPWHPALLALTAAMVCSWWVSWHSLRRAHGEVLSVLLQTNDEWVVTSRRTGPEPARLEPDYFLTPWLAVLGLRLRSGRRVGIVISAENAPAAAFRRLRVRLRHPALRRG